MLSSLIAAIVAASGPPRAAATATCAAMTRRTARRIPHSARADVLEPLDEAVDHVRGPASARVVLEYGDYQCPYSRAAVRSIERVESRLSGGVRFAFRHFPL